MRVINKANVSPSYNEENNPWIVNFLTGLFGKMGTADSNEKCVGFLGLNENNECPYYDAIATKNKVFFIPKTLTKILYYDVEKRVMGEMILEHSYAEERSYGVFFTSFLIDGRVWLFGHAYSAVVIIDPNTLEITYLRNWVDKIRGLIKEPARVGYFSSRQYVLEKGFLYIPFSNATAILKVELETLKDNVIQINADTDGFSCICKMDSEHYCLTGCCNNSDCFLVWNVEQNTIEKNIRLQETPNELPVIRMLRAENGDVYIFPWQNWLDYDLDILKYNHSTLEIENMMILDFEKKRGGSRITNYDVLYAEWISDTKFLFVTGNDLKWHEYDVVSGQHNIFEKYMDEDRTFFEMCKKYYLERSSKHIPFSENEIDLESFISMNLR